MKRKCCSSSVIENQYLIKIIPERTSIFSNSGTSSKNWSYCSSVQNPITFSTPARLYQLRSNKTISPPAGKCVIYLWKYHCVLSRSLGAGRATVLQTRGFKRCMIRLIAPPLPAESRPSNMTSTLSFFSTTQSCNLTSSPCSLKSSLKYFWRAAFFSSLSGSPLRRSSSISSSSSSSKLSNIS